MKVKEKNTKPLAGFSKTKSLDKYSKMDLFKGKVKMVNHILKTVGLPK